MKMLKDGWAMTEPRGSIESSETFVTVRGFQEVMRNQGREA